MERKQEKNKMKNERCRLGTKMEVCGGGRFLIDALFVAFILVAASGFCLGWPGGEGEGFCFLVGGMDRWNANKKKLNEEKTLATRE